MIWKGTTTKGFDTAKLNNMPRNTQAIRQWRIISRLLRHKSLSIMDFRDLIEEGNLHKKTIRRDLEALTQVPEFQIQQYNIHGKMYWRMDAKLEKEIGPLPLKEKRCTGCGNIRPIHEYHKMRSTADGYKTQCRFCVSEWARDYYSRNREVILRTNKARNKRYRNKE